MYVFIYVYINHIVFVFLQVMVMDSGISDLPTDMCITHGDDHCADTDTPIIHTTTSQVNDNLKPYLPLALTDIDLDSLTSHENTHEQSDVDWVAMSEHHLSSVASDALSKSQHHLSSVVSDALLAVSGDIHHLVHIPDISNKPITSSASTSHNATKCSFSETNSKHEMGSINNCETNTDSQRRFNSVGRPNTDYHGQWVSGEHANLAWSHTLGEDGNYSRLFDHKYMQANLPMTSYSVSERQSTFTDHYFNADEYHNHANRQYSHVGPVLNMRPMIHPGLVPHNDLYTNSMNTPPLPYRHPYTMNNPSLAHRHPYPHSMNNPPLPHGHPYSHSVNNPPLPHGHPYAHSVNNPIIPHSLPYCHSMNNPPLKEHSLMTRSEVHNRRIINDNRVISPPHVSSSLVQPDKNRSATLFVQDRLHNRSWKKTGNVGLRSWSRTDSNDCYDSEATSPDEEIDSHSLNIDLEVRVQMSLKYI